MQVDPAALEPLDAYRLLISCVVPRPIAWVSTIAPDGTRNAAPFSFFQVLTTKPPMLMIAVGPRGDGRHKDTRQNIETTGEFVVNVVSEPSAQRMVDTSAGFEPEVSEFEEIGLEETPSKVVKPPRIAECKVAMECALNQVIEVGEGGGAMILGKIVWFHVADEVLADDGKTVDPRKLAPLGRMGANNYAPLREVLEVTPTRRT